MSKVYSINHDIFVCSPTVYDKLCLLLFRLLLQVTTTIRMGKFEGIATMYMTMPMASQALPLLGACSVDDKKITLKFPLSNVSFDLPQAPSEGANDLQFNMAGPKGEMTLNISWKADMGAFVGQGKQDGSTVLAFVFYKEGSALKHLKSL